MIQSELLYSLLTWLLVVTTLSVTLNIIYYKKREVFEKHGITIHPLGLIYRRRVSFSFTDKLPRRVMRALFTLGIAIFAYSLYNFYLMFLPGLIKKLEGEQTQPLITIPIPGVTIVSPEMIVYFFVAVSVAVIAHEVAHGIAARIEGIPVRNAGIVLFFYTLFAAFVEPDEKSYENSRLISKLRVASAGIAANVAIAFIILIALSLLGNSASTLVVTGVVKGSPAEKAGLRPGDAILYVNSTSIQPCFRINVYDLLIKSPLDVFIREPVRCSLSIIADMIRKSNVVNVTVVRDGRIISILVKPEVVNGTKRIGVYFGLGTVNMPLWLLLLLLFIAQINLALAAINAAPIVITDGARIITDLLSGYGKLGKAIITAIQLFTVIVVIANFGLIRIA